MLTHLVQRPPRRTPQAQTISIAALALVALTAGAALSGCAPKEMAALPPGSLAEGQRIFRFDTFGDEPFWTDTLHLNEVVEKSVDPTTALKVGLKVDADVLPPGILQKVDLKSPATTVALLKMNAVVGLQASVDSQNHITRLGITCAFCHSTVDNSVMPGIGTGRTAGRTGISTSERSSRSPRYSPRTRKPSTTRGVRASTTRASTSTGRTRHS